MGANNPNTTVWFYNLGRGGQILTDMGWGKVQGTLRSMEFYTRNTLLMRTFFQLFMKKKLEDMFRKSLVNLEGLVRQIEVPVEF